MQLVIKGGKVRAVYGDEVNVESKYDLTEYEIVQLDGSEQFVIDLDSDEPPDDPRTPAERLTSQRRRYLARRRQAYPSIRQCLAMIYQDMRDGTTEYVDAITSVNETFPKPE